MYLENLRTRSPVATISKDGALLGLAGHTIADIRSLSLTATLNPGTWYSYMTSIMNLSRMHRQRLLDLRTRDAVALEGVEKLPREMLRQVQI